MIALLFLFACDDLLFGEKGTEPVPEGQGWCAVQDVFEASCLDCHAAAGTLGGLDLETDPHGALVNITSVAYGLPLVTPNDPDDSLLIRKLEGTQAASGEGGVMPLGGILDPETTDLVRQWVADGADSVCDAPTTTDTESDTGDDGYHPIDWSDPTVHGMAAKFQTELDCRTCHGPLLEGVGEAVGCDDCHAQEGHADWRTECTFCHGGEEISSGAPPTGIDDSSPPRPDPFERHTAHLRSDWTNISCDTCHVFPDSALSPGHLFDDNTPGVAELTFGHVALGGSYTGGTCTVYCHGTGLADGSITQDDGPRDCGSCHGAPDDIIAAAAMSGEHRKHLAEGLICEDCHGNTVNGGNVIIDEALHINGTPDMLMPLVFNGTACDGSCHGETHNYRDW